ncbi:sugar phosphate isomerase/epimerase family protein [Microbacterium ureisolvens]|uniref:Sugar phosphate isomerase/epimerase n=1 Tax=Microbacterium ureisolvens TaxID=2781186 RepID=A0ABS7HWH0_9MICO|nr:sugar phosphate isomerase/epimerase family protein [Microbacterium ureisolvens]MBW9109145.1 sugar phosphate isomerase/epimerase [Microbacterium ureisolvens]
MLSSNDWPIAAALLPLGDAHPVDGPESSAERWLSDLSEVSDAGFSDVDLTDSWTRYGDLDRNHVAALRECLAATGLTAVSLSAIRRSVIDEQHGQEHLAYAHRTIDFAAELGIPVVSVGLHRALTPAQREQLWFWTADGHRDPFGDDDAWALAVGRLRELGRHADEAGLLLSLEMYEHTFLGSAESSVRLVEDIGLDAVGLNPDIGNLIRLHEPVEDWRAIAEATMPYANFWHVKNYSRDEDAAAGLYSTVPTSLELGVINYREAVKIALRNGFQGIICVEHYGGDGLSVSATNRDYLRDRVLPRREYAAGVSRVRQTGASAVSR